MSDTEEHQDHQEEDSHPVEEEVVEEEVSETVVSSTGGDNCPLPPSPVNSNATLQNTDAANRARKAQKTRRVKVNIPPKPAPPQNAAPAKGPANKGKKPPTPVVEPEDVGELDEDIYAEEDDDYEDGEPSKVLAGLLGMLQGVLYAFKALWHLIRGVLATVGQHFVYLVGFGLFYVLLYLSASYLVNEARYSQLYEASERLTYVLRGHIWTLIPILLGLAGVQFSGGPSHAKYAREVVEQGSILFINTTILSTYVSPACAHWVWTTLVLLSSFRVLQWVFLKSKNGSLKTILTSPSIAVNLLLGAYNVWVILGADLSPPPEPPAPSIQVQTEPGWF